MIERILLAVHDSPASMVATEAAIEMAARFQAKVCAVTVVVDHGVGERLTAALAQPATLARRREQAATSILAHVTRLAASHGVPVQTRVRYGEPAARVLEEAHSWPADLLVMGHARRRGAGQPYVGPQTQHVLEFAEQPVLVVPVPGRRAT